MILTFVAPRPGTYTILAAAKPGRPGVGLLHVDVKRPRWPARSVYHDDSEAGGFGLPAPPPARPSASAELPPPVPPPAAPAPAASVPPAPPVDEPIALR